MTPASRVRLIPAHAGKTVRLPPSMATARAHPRSRGENGRGLGAPRGIRGSSPLTRGKLVDAVARAIEDGLIPAHAGKTVAQSIFSKWNGAHPRSRGENAGEEGFEEAVVGSSPLTRGKLDRHQRAQAWPGLIPAHAGKTAFSRVSSWRASAHPRSRGENQGVPAPACMGQGSSPLTRGKRQAAGAGDLEERLIPAHAGKTRGKKPPPLQ